MLNLGVGYVLLLIGLSVFLLGNMAETGIATLRLIWFGAFLASGILIASSGGPPVNPRNMVLLGFIIWLLPGSVDPELWHRFHSQTSIMAVTVLYVSIGCFLLGYSAPSRARVHVPEVGFMIDRLGIVGLRFLPVVLLVYLAVGYGGGFFVALSMGVFQINPIEMMGRFGFMLGELAPIYYIVSRLLISSTLLAMIILVEAYHCSWIIRAIASAHLIVIIAATIASYGTRAHIAAALFAAMVLYLERKSTLKAMLIGLVLVAFLLVLSSLRIYHLWDPMIATAPLMITSNNTLDFFSSLAIFDAPNRWLWGQSLYAPLTFWVPRFLWPGKPYGFGYQLALAEGYPPELVAAGGTLPGELYANFGLLGVGVGMWITGYIARRLFDFRDRASADPFIGALYGFSLFYLFMEVRGDFYSQTTEWIAGIIYVLIARQVSMLLESGLGALRTNRY